MREVIAGIGLLVCLFLIPGSAFAYWVPDSYVSELHIVISSLPTNEICRNSHSGHSYTMDNSIANLRLSKAIEYLQANNNEAALSELQPGTECTGAGGLAASCVRKEVTSGLIPQFFICSGGPGSNISFRFTS